MILFQEMNNLNNGDGLFETYNCLASPINSSDVFDFVFVF